MIRMHRSAYTLSLLPKIYTITQHIKQERQKLVKHQITGRRELNANKSNAFNASLKVDLYISFSFKIFTTQTTGELLEVRVGPHVSF